MKHSAVGQRERATVVTKSHIDKIYTDGFKDGVRKMRKKLKLKGKNMIHPKYHIDCLVVSFEDIDQIAKERVEEDT